MDLLELIRHPEQAGRLKEIVRTLMHYRMGDWFKDVPFKALRDMLADSKSRAMRDRPLPERLRLALTEMGPTFIKLGQVLSTRADLVSPEIADELRKLQADTPADPPEVVRRTIQDELGKSPEDLFAEFEPAAFSSASIGQVHRARLADGQPVVVKVQHEAIQEKVRIDLELLLALAKVLQEHVRQGRKCSRSAVIDPTRAFSPSETTRASLNKNRSAISSL